MATEKDKSAPLDEKQLRIIMNNFWMRLPDDFYPRIPGNPEIASGYDREVLRDKIDYPISQTLSTQDRERHGILYLGQTQRQFFVQIDELIAEFGLAKQAALCFISLHNPERIRQENQYLAIPLDDDRIPLQERLAAFQERMNWRWSPTEVSRVAFPVFQRMLEIGYTERDLIA